jgi:hypothetical protein
LHRKWTQLGCDDLLRKHSETVHNAVEQAKPAVPVVEPSAKKEKGKKKGKGKETVAGIVDINQDNKGKRQSYSGMALDVLVVVRDLAQQTALL